MLAADNAMAVKQKDIDQRLLSFFCRAFSFFCIGRQINKEQALLGGIQLIVSEELRWNVNVQHARSREGETDEAWERICLCLSLFFPPPPFLLSPRNGHCRRYILVLASHNSEIFNPIFWSRVNMSNCWRVDQGFVLFPLQNVNQGVASCHGDRLDGSRWNSSWQLFIWIELCRHQIWPRPSPCACHTLIFWYALIANCSGLWHQRPPAKRPNAFYFKLLKLIFWQSKAKQSTLRLISWLKMIDSLKYFIFQKCSI